MIKFSLFRSLNSNQKTGNVRLEALRAPLLVSNYKTTNSAVGVGTEGHHRRETPSSHFLGRR